MTAARRCATGTRFTTKGRLGAFRRWASAWSQTTITFTGFHRHFGKHGPFAGLEMWQALFRSFQLFLQVYLFYAMPCVKIVKMVSLTCIVSRSLRQPTSSYCWKTSGSARDLLLIIYIYRKTANKLKFVQLVELVMLIAIFFWDVFIIFVTGSCPSNSWLALRTWPPPDVLGLLGIGVGPADWLHRCIWKDEISQLGCHLEDSRINPWHKWLWIKKHREVKRPMCYCIAFFM